MATVNMFSKTIIFVFLMLSFVFGAPHDDITESSNYDYNSPSIEVQELNPSLRFTEIVKYYFALSLQANWTTALQHCQLNGMQLASITSQEENDKIKEVIENSTVKHFWTSGAKFPGKDGKYFWMSTGRPFDYDNWGSTEPNNWGGIEYCMQIRQWDDKSVSWNDRDCSHQINFICEVRKRVCFLNES